MVTETRVSLTPSVVVEHTRTAPRRVYLRLRATYLMRKLLHAFHAPLR